MAHIDTQADRAMSEALPTPIITYSFQGGEHSDVAEDWNKCERRKIDAALRRLAKVMGWRSLLKIRLDRSVNRNEVLVDCFIEDYVRL